MRIPALLFALVLAAGLLLLAAVTLLPETPQLRVHPEYATLLQGEDGAARSAPVWWIGAAFGLVQIAFFGACFALGMSRGGRVAGLGLPIAVGLALYAAVFVLLLVTYRLFLGAPGEHLVLGFPLPTAVMIYLLWPVPLWFLWLYLRNFDRHVLSAGDLERVRRIARECAEERQREGEAGPR